MVCQLRWQVSANEWSSKVFSVLELLIVNPKCLLWSEAIVFSIPIEPFHMTSRRPYWCPKTTKRRPCWCSKPILWELNSFLMQTLSFVPINLRRCWSRERKRSTPDCFTCWHKQLFGSVWTASAQNWKDVSKIEGENEKWELSRELEMKWQLWPWFKLGFVPIFYFPVPHARSPPAPHSRNIPTGTPHHTRTVWCT